MDEFGSAFPFFFMLAFMCMAIVVSAIVVAWPASMVCRRVGFSPWLAILAVVPLANLFLLWYIALSDWPNLPRQPQPVAQRVP